MKKLILFIIPAFLFFSFINKNSLQSPESTPSDPMATSQTKALYANLKSFSKDHVLFGHQDAMAYGVTWKNWYKNRSDVNDVIGKHPAVFGWDMSKLGKSPLNIDTVNFESMKGWMKEVYKMGSINTISWHMDNFLDGKTSWDTGENVVAAILPGGEKHEAYTAKLDLFADFVTDLKVGFIFKKDIPIIFRPFHEHTGAWFWWGQPHCTPEEYKSIWRFTVQYLRDVKDLHNILYAYSPDVFRDRAHYLECYPGDEWVDILGFDDYHDLGSNGKTEDLIRRLGIITDLSEEKGKVSAITETGLESIPDPEWWTERLLAPIKSDPKASRIAWVLVWRNARPSHHYAPYPGHASVPDFIQFEKDPFTWFQGDFPNPYK